MNRNKITQIAHPIDGVTKQLLEALLHSYIENNDLENIYNEDGTKLMAVNEAVKLVGLKERASPEQVRFESLFDTMMEEFRNHFPSSVGESERGGTWFDLMHSIWNKHVQVELMEKYSNL